MERKSYNKYKSYGYIRQINENRKKRLERMKGKEEDKEISDASNELYYSILVVATEVYEEEGEGKWEQEYRTGIRRKLEERGYTIKEEKVVRVKGEEGGEHVIRLDISCEEDGETGMIIEVKRGNTSRKGIMQLREYMRKMKKGIGFLVSYGSKETEVLMILREEEEGIEEYYTYDNKVLRKMEKEIVF
jgi:GxxExxY protein